jgi:hypothetical protein
MPRNSSGTFSPPTGQPVVSHTTVSSATHNALVSDLGTELTDSLSRSGKGAMAAPLRVPDGSVSAPTLAFANDTDSGLYRAGAGDVRLAVNGVDRLAVTGDGLSIAGGLVVTSPLSRDAMPPVGQSISASSGAWSTSSVTPVAVSNLTVNISTTGRPVLIGLVAAGANLAGIGSSEKGIGLWLQRNGTDIAAVTCDRGTVGSSLLVPPPGVLVLDVVEAGSYTYAIKAETLLSGSSAYVYYCRLFAFEL